MTDDFPARARAHLAKNAATQAAADPLARDLIAAMLPQLLIVLVSRAGGEVRVPVAEIDATGDRLLGMRVDGSDFVFEVRKKQ